MRIRFKPINRSLPGCNWNKMPPITRGMRRNHYKGAIRKEYLDSHKPDQSGPIVVSTKLLILDNPPHTSVWKKLDDMWRCVESPEPFDWFLTIRNFNKIREYLLDKNIKFNWKEHTVAA